MFGSRIARMMIPRSCSRARETLLPSMVSSLLSVTLSVRFTPTNAPIRSISRCGHHRKEVVNPMLSAQGRPRARGVRPADKLCFAQIRAVAGQDEAYALILREPTALTCSVEVRMCRRMIRTAWSLKGGPFALLSVCAGFSGDPRSAHCRAWGRGCERGCAQEPNAPGIWEAQSHGQCGADPAETAGALQSHMKFP